MGIDTGEVARLAFDLEGAASKVVAKADQAIRLAGFQVENLGRRNAPYKTGNLKNSIGVSVLGPARVVVGPTAHYGVYQEFGTRYIQGKHYMGRAADAVTPGLIEAMAQLGVDVIGGG